MSSAAVVRREKLDRDYATRKAGQTRPAAGRRNRVRMDYRALFLKSSLTFIFIAAFCFPIIWIHASITNLELERGRLLKKIELENQLLQERKIEFARLSDPARIRSIAASRLKMKDPEKVVYIFFGPKGVKSAAIALSQLGEVFNSTEVASKMR